MIEKATYSTCKENATNPNASHDIKGSIERTASLLDEISDNVDFLGLFLCGIRTPDEVVETTEPSFAFLGVAQECEINEAKAHDILRRLILLRGMMGVEEYTGDR